MVTEPVERKPLDSFRDNFNSNELIHVLLTPNVFQNCNSTLRNDYADTVRFLREIIRCKSIIPYMISYDKESLKNFNEYFGLYRAVDVYGLLIQKVQQIAIDSCIRDEAKLYGSLSAVDAVRIAAAIDHQLDAVVTWEPHHFMISETHHRQLERNRHFDFTPYVPSNQNLTEDLSKVTVYSVREFWLSLDHRNSSVEANHPIQWSPGFYIDSAKMSCVSSIDRTSYECTVSIRHAHYGHQERCGTGIDIYSAIKLAIDGFVDEFYSLPSRDIISYSCEYSTSMGHLQPLNKVTIRGRCGGFEQEFHNSDINLYRAMAKCYCRFIEAVCQATQS